MSDEQLPVSEDPFVVFGVTPDVSDRDLKKRYFALMRQFAPETHPDEFSRLQAAYERIKDPEAREQMRDGPFPTVAEPYRSRLRDVLKLLTEGQLEFARTQLKTLVEENPGLNEAHFLLGQLELNEGNFATAEQCFRTLHEREPANAGYWQRLAQSLLRLERYDEAEVFAEAWLKTYPKDPFAWRILGDALVGQKHHDVALIRLKDAIAAIAAEAPYPYELALHRLGFARWVMGFQIAGDLAAMIAAAGKDEDIRKSLATDFTALAALYFDRERPDDANLLLRHARELTGKAEGLAFPVKVTRYVEELPAASIDWLKEEVKTPHIHNLRFGGVGKDLAMALAATAVLGVSSAIGFSSATPYDGVGLGFLFLFLAGLTTWAAWAWHQLSWSWKSPLARMTVLHPLFLLEVDYEKFTAWSLVTYTGGDVLHHSNNGAYTSSEVLLRFGSIKKSISVNGADAAVDLVNAIGGWSKRSLELLHGGVLEAEQGVDFLPMKLLDPDFKSPLVRRRRLEAARRYGIATAVAAAITGIVMLATDFRGRGRALDAAVASQAPDAILAYLAEHPDDDFQQQVTQWRSAQLDRSLGQMRAEALPEDPGRENLARLEASLRAAASRQLPVGVSLKFDEANVDALVKKGLRVPPPQQLKAWANRVDATWLIPTLEQNVDPRVATALDFTQLTKKEVPRVLLLDLTARWTEPGFRHGASDYPSLAVDGLAFFTAEGKTQSFPLKAALGREELDQFTSDPGDAAICDRQMRALLVKLGPSVLQQLGLAKLGN